MKTVFERTQAQAGGRRLDASPLAMAPTPLAGSGSSLLLGSRSLLLTADPESLNLLSRGAAGPDVAFLQALLGDLTIDRWFGPLTEARVREKQRDLGIHVDGDVGPETWGALADAYK